MKRSNAKKRPLKAKSSPKTALQKRAERRLDDIVDFAFNFPALRKRGPKAPGWQVGVRLTGDAEIAKLNARYRGKHYATDVLSFSAPEPFHSLGYLGELVVGYSVLKRQAKEHGHRPEVELEVLLTHGVLHLLGFDHEKGPRQAREMERWEARLLSNPGLIARSRG